MSWVRKKLKIRKKSAALFALGSALLATLICAEIKPNPKVDKTSSADPPKEGTARILFEQPRFDFGRIGQGETLRKKFEFKNVGNADLVIRETKTSCGCTAALASTAPVHPNESGAVDVAYDSRGKFGHVYKDVKIFSNDPASPSTIAIEGVVTAPMHPAMGPGDVLFAGSCAECHSIPAKGKTGKELYDSVCAICHDPPANSHKFIAASRHSMSQISRRDLKNAISKGVPNSSMPAFSDSSSGPLSKEQIKSLADYLYSIRVK